MRRGIVNNVVVDVETSFWIIGKGIVKRGVAAFLQAFKFWGNQSFNRKQGTSTRQRVAFPREFCHRVHIAFCSREWLCIFCLFIENPKGQIKIPSPSSMCVRKVLDAVL